MNISIPDEVIQRIIIDSLKSNATRMFSPAQYGYQAGAGYVAIEEAVVEWIKNGDIVAEIEDQAYLSIQKVLPNAVDKAIKNRAGSILAGIIRSGQLDDQIIKVIESKMAK